MPVSYHDLMPVLIVDRGVEAIGFYERALGAVELFRVEQEGKISHAELSIGDSRVGLTDEQPGIGVLGPRGRGGTTVALTLFFDNVDAAFARAILAGGQELVPLKDENRGERAGWMADPFGHVWCLSSRPR